MLAPLGILLVAASTVPTLASLAVHFGAARRVVLRSLGVKRLSEHGFLLRYFLPISLDVELRRVKRCGTACSKK
jgi:hypothetical protein